MQNIRGYWEKCSRTKERATAWDGCGRVGLQKYKRRTHCGNAFCILDRVSENTVGKIVW